MKITFLIDLDAQGVEGYQQKEVYIPIIPRKGELVTIDEKFVNYVVAEIFHQIVNGEQKILIILVPPSEK